MTPFSHIQVVDHPYRGDSPSNKGSPETVFRRPSLSQQVRRGEMAGYQPRMGARGGGMPSAAPASLANLTSGTTFAAAARQAELNAARANKQKAQEAESRIEVPDIEPLSLGALKFTKTRRGGSRTRGWKTLNLEDIPDSSEDENTTQLPLSQKPINQYQKLEQGPLLGSMRRQRNRSTDNDDKRAPSVDPIGTSQLPVPDYEKRINSIQTSFPPSVHALFDSVKWDPDAPSFQPSGMSTKNPSGAMNQSNENIPPNRYSRNPSVGPSGTSSKAPTTAASASQGKHIHHEDPFTETVNHLAMRTAQANRQTGQPNGAPAQKYRVLSNLSYGPQQQQQLMHSGQQSALPGQKQPLPAVKGTMDFTFRFPNSIQPSMNAQSPSGHIKPNTDPKSTTAPAVPKQSNKNTSVNAYQRDPKPYTSFSTTSKKEMLLQNLEEMVKVSEAQGNLPTSTRTVLYDPVTRQTGNLSRGSNQLNVGQSEIDKESLKTRYDPRALRSSTSSFDGTANSHSDPLPWKDRPVDIYNPRYNDPDWREPPSFPPGLAQGNEYIYSLAAQPKPAGRPVDELQRWWTTDNRTQGLSRIHMDQINEAQCKPTTTPTRRSKANSMESLSSPPSGRTGSSFAAIGSERSSKKASTVGSSVDSEGMTHLLKASLINLQSYVDGSGNDDYFGRFARVPEWCIDKSPGGNDSYFGDWGSPPSRVGRDPRYRPTYHEGRYTVFEELDRRGGREIMARRLR